MKRAARSTRSGIAERLYRLILLSYPSEFRRAHAQDAAEVFGDLYRSERARGGMVAVLRLWGRTFVQVFGGGIKERWPSLERREIGSPRRRLVADDIPASTQTPPPRRTVPASLGEVVRDVIADFHYTLRTALKTPGFTIVVILTLALGIGATTAVFSVVNGVLLEPLPYEDPDELVIMYEHWSNFGTVTVAYPNFVDWRDRNTSFESLAAWNWTETNLTGVGDPVHLNACRVSADMFETLRVQPALGRDFTEEEGEVGGPAVTILSHGLWQSRFGSDPDVVGRVVSINDNPFTIVGVMAREFVFPQLSSTPDLYLPIGQFAESWVQNRSNHPGIAVLGRLKKETSFERAVADMEAVAVGLEEQYPEHNTGSRIRMWPLHERLLGDIEPVLWILFSAVAFVLLIACVNVANLLLARGASREQEMAIRSALGAGGGRIVRLVMTESIVFWLCGGLVGILLARLGTRSLTVWLADSMPRTGEISIEGGVLSFALVISMITGVIFGLMPALRSARMNLQEALKEGGRSTPGEIRSRTRKRLVIAEFALAQALLVAAGLTIHSFALLVSTDPGLEVDNVLTLRISLPEARYPELEDRHAFFNEVRERVQGMPSVVSAAVGGPLPLSPKGGWQQGYYVEGEPVGEPGEVTLAEVAAASPEYHQTLGIPLLRGRMFEQRDATAGLRPVIVDETFVARHWPDKDPLGKRIIFGIPESEADLDDASWMEVVGVVGNVKNNGVANDSLVQLYIPFESDHDNTWSLVIRGEGDPLQLIEPARAAVLELDPDQPISDVSTMASNLELTTVSNRMLSALLGAFATVALLLASVGIYGVISYDTSQRTHEIGVRMAIGAAGGEVLLMVVRQALMMVGIGIALGIVLSLLASQWLSAELYGVSPVDPITLIGAPLFLCAIALVATLLPARRAARVDPLIALRSE